MYIGSNGHSVLCYELIILLFSLLKGSKQLIPEASQAGPLHVFKSYKDVTLFHFTIPKGIQRATWHFGAFMDGIDCIPREVNIYIQFGSFPVINVNNASFPANTNDKRSDNVVIKTLTKYETETTVIVPIDSPEPGDWFVGAYMSYFDEKVQQQGFGHKCHYSIGSVAIWQTINVIQNIPIGRQHTLRTTQPSTYYKFFIPSGTSMFRIDITGCRVMFRGNNADLCIKGILFQGRKLPFFNHTSENGSSVIVNGNFSFEEATPFEESYYYFLVVSDSIVQFNIEITLSECPVQITDTSSAHKWQSRFNTSFQVIPPQLTDFEEPENWTLCPRRLQLIRVKQIPILSSVYLFQGREWLTPWLLIADENPVIAQFDILPLVDIGGSLGVGIHLDIDTKYFKQSVEVLICIRRGRMPSRKTSEMICDDERMEMRLDTNSKRDGNLLIPYPQPDTWFIGVQAKCFHNRKLTPCERGEILMSLDVRTQKCSFQGSQPCGHYGSCEEIHRNTLHYTTCNCVGGYSGWGCTDGRNAYQQPSLVISSLMLIFSNLFFLPAIYLALRRRLYTEALVYTATTLFSSLYHACDQKLVTYCIAKYDVLQFSDFFTSILAFWVTLIAMAQLPIRYVSVSHMFGVLIISFGVEANRTGLVSVLVPLIIGAGIPIGVYLYRCYRSKYWRKPDGFVKILIGLSLASTGIILFAAVETEANYQYVHSMWHMIIATSLLFLLPTVPVKCNHDANLSNSELVVQAESPVFSIGSYESSRVVEN